VYTNAEVTPRDTVGVFDHYTFYSMIKFFVLDVSLG
jgi:hypothetical protein